VYDGGLSIEIAYAEDDEPEAICMRQIWITKAGPPEVLETKEAPDPQPKAGEVRIRVEASGVNFADIMGRLGIYPDLPPMPVVPGYEVAGRIDAVGEGVDAGWAGRDVFAVTRFGGYADVVCVPIAQVFSRPADMSASLIGRLGASTFRLSAATVWMSLTGSCFSSESAPRPFHHGFRRQGGTIFGSALPSE
jgi:NADPH:quinone reductase-like Zn-dependent oxidoreductase